MSEKARVLIVDDEKGIRDLLSMEFSARGFRVQTAADGEEALRLFRAGKFELVFSDVKMPRMDGLALLEAVKKIDPDAEMIMSTGYGTIETAVTAMKQGAYDFVQKPYDLEEVFVLVDKALEKNELRALVGVYQASKAVFSSLDIDQLLPLLADISARVLKADDASIMLACAEGELRLAASSGKAAKTANASIGLGERIAGRVALSRDPIVINGPVNDDPRFLHVPPFREIRSAVIFPLAIGEEILGVLSASRTTSEEPFGQSDLRHAMILASQIAQAIRNAKLYRDLEDKMRQIQDMQGQLVQAEKMSAIGQLAAGVAHEINNPLMGIMGHGELLLRAEGLSAEQRTDLETVLYQARRCRDIVKNLLDFSRRRKKIEESVDVAATLGITLRLVAYDFKSAGISLALKSTEDLRAVIGDSAQLEQVFLNIITNARQALDGRANASLVIHTKQNDGNIAIIFEDNGPGIALEALGKIFDPFFTTKPVGQGTGLGLSISHGIIRQHGGDIRAESAAGRGTRFIVELPCAARAPEQAPLVRNSHE